jgi:hypothetical protein
MTPLPTTESGLPIDERFSQPASPEQLARAAGALASNGGFLVEVVDTVADARETVLGLLNEGDKVFTVSSETLRVSGLEADITESGRYEPIRPKLLALRAEGRMAEVRALGQAPDVVVGSVQAVTEDGRVVSEDIRARAATGKPSKIGKISSSTVSGSRAAPRSCSSASRSGSDLTRFPRARSESRHSNEAPVEISPAPMAGDPRGDFWLYQRTNAGCLASEAVVVRPSLHVSLVLSGKARDEIRVGGQDDLHRKSRVRLRS